MKRVLKIAGLAFAAFLCVPATLLPQEANSREELLALRDRVRMLERQNAEFQEQLRLVRTALDKLAPSATGGTAPAATPEARIEALEEKVTVQDSRLTEHERVKVESVSKTPVRISGVVLFNAFANSRHGNAGADEPRFAGIPSVINGAGANFRQSVLGLDFQSPGSIFGGLVKGGIFVDFFTGLDAAPASLGVTPRLRTAWIEVDWKTRTLEFGQERPIFAPREPFSLARMGFTPLVGAGSLYTWEPQIRLEQRLKLAANNEFRLRVGAVQTIEDQTNRFPATPLPAKRRPGVEGHLQFSHRIDDFRRFEVASGFHLSTTHVAGISVPSQVVSVDWFYNPHRRVEFTGSLYRGKNMFMYGGLLQGFTFTTVGGPRAAPIRSQGGWAQMTLIAAPRLTFNFSGGTDDPTNRDLLLNFSSAATPIARNRVWVANMMFRIAPNVVIGPEFSQARTLYINGIRPLNNHYDLSAAYFF